ncbi:hypothetical protein [Turneriella parva]|uniref:Uncharacterized protein n=1 Tax=Turneriella parva (strain ATCC BAA-1111 / DSM 21527 / NCTC 11395 / H) TaxID=869212 RepID=I4B249_TURPD|nr:hypothetical protein [Turneriella parva]AFM11356.1 hypothetical protein Turpa_0705 [Turneriella parva DSM 21527]
MATEIITMASGRHRLSAMTLVMLSAQLLNCYSYEVKLITQATYPATYAVPKPCVTQIDEALEPDSRLRNAIENYLVKRALLGNQSNGQAASARCLIKFLRIGRNEFDGKLLLTIFSLGLIPVYNEYPDGQKVEIAYSKNEAVIHKKVYTISSTAVIWLPLIVSGLWEREKYEKAVDLMLDDFFFNELPRAQAAAAHQD